MKTVDSILLYCINLDSDSTALLIEAIMLPAAFLVSCLVLVGRPLTVKHILVDCPDLQATRLKYFTVLSLKDTYLKVSTITSLLILSKKLFL